MPDFMYLSKVRLELHRGWRHAYLGEIPEPVVYGVQGALREHYRVREGVPSAAATLDHIVAAVGG